MDILLKAVAVLAPIFLTKYLLHDAIYFEHHSVVVEWLDFVNNNTDAVDWDILGLCEPRWSSFSGLSGGQDATLVFPDDEHIQYPVTLHTADITTGRNMCSSLACVTCSAQDKQPACYSDKLSYQQWRQPPISSTNKFFHDFKSTAVAGDIDVSSQEHGTLVNSDVGRFAQIFAYKQPTAGHGLLDVAENLTTDGAAAPLLKMLTKQISQEPAVSQRGTDARPEPAACTGQESPAATFDGNGYCSTPVQQLIELDLIIKTSDVVAVRSNVQTETAEHTEAAEATCPRLSPLQQWDSASIPTDEQLSQNSSDVGSEICQVVGSYIPAAAHLDAAAAEGASAISKPAEPAAAAAQQGRTADAAVVSTAAAAEFAANDVIVRLQQHSLAGTGLAALQAGWAPDTQLMPFISPALLKEAWSSGVSRFSLSVPPVSWVVISLLACAVLYLCWSAWSQGRKVSLPQSVSQKNLRKLDLRFTLQKLSYQQAMWFRLLGVSGAAVLGVHRAQQRCKQAVVQAKGTAQFARDLMRCQRKRLQRQHDEELAALQQQLQYREESHSLLQQQYVVAQQQHVHEMQQQQHDAERHQAAADQQHKRLLEQHQQLEQQWQQEFQKQQAKHAADVRSKADVIAEQRACVASLSQQLIEVKSERAGLSSELQRVREQLVVERSRVEFILQEEQQVKGKAADVNQKYQLLQDQLSEVRSSNAQLTNEVQHLQAAHAAADSTIHELQQQLASTSSQLVEGRAVSAEYASKVAQLEERSKGLQERLSSIQAVRDDLTGQLRELQGLHAAAEATSRDLQHKLCASTAAAADGRAIVVQLQEQQKQLEDRATEQKDRLSELQGRHQQLQTTLTAAEASISELRGEKQAIERKAEQAQQQVSSTLAELGQLRSEHATATAQLQRSKEASQQLQGQLGILQAQYKEQTEHLAALQQAMSTNQQQLELRVQQLETEVAQQQAELASRQKHNEELSSRLQQEQGIVTDLHVQLKTLSKACTELEDSRNLLDQHLEESMQLIEEREADLQRVQEQKAALETELTAVRANLTTRTATLREAQASLSDTEGKLHEEYEKNWEMSRDNMQLQQQLDTVKDHNRQLDQDLEYLTSDHDDLVTKLEKLTASYEVMLQESNGIQLKTEGLLAENLDSLVELEGKYTAAQAGLSAVTKERDDLAKRLFWAEIARDQQGAAKNLANEEAIAARKDLLEEKLNKSRQVASPVASGGAAVAGGALGGAGANGGGAEDRPTLSRTSSRGRAWPEVKTGYLHQQFSDRPPTGRTNSSHSHSSPRSPVHSPTPSAESAMFTPLSGLQGSVLKTGVSPSSSRCSSAPCTPRSGEEAVDSASMASDSSLPVKQSHQQQPEHPGQTPGASAVVCSGSRLRRSSSMPLVPDVVRAGADDAGQGSAAMAPMINTSVAAAVESLRRNFSNSNSSVIDGDHSSKEAATAGKTNPQLDGGCAVSDQQTATPDTLSRNDPVEESHDQVQQQQQLPSSPTKTSPPPLESSHSPNIASSGKSGSRNDRSRGSRPDRSLLPLNLSPVPFDLRASNDVCTSSAVTSPHVASAGAMLAPSAGDSSSSNAGVLDAQQEGVPASPAPSKQQQPEEFFTPAPPIGWQTHAAAGGVTPSAAGAAATPYYTPEQVQPSSAAASDHHVADAPDEFSEISCSNVRSLRSTSELDDEADVLIGSMSESDFAAAVSRSSYEAAEPAAAISNNNNDAGTGLWLSSDMQRQQQLAAEAAAVARRQQSRLAHASSGLQSLQQQGTDSPDAAETGGQQPQPAKLSKNQKKKLRLKQKRQAAALQQSLQQTSMDDATTTHVLTGLVAQQSDEQLAGASCEDSVLSDDAHTELHLSAVYDSREDAPLGRGRADSPPKMFIRGPAAAGMQSGGSSAGSGGRYGSPVKGRGVPSTPFAASVAASGLIPAGSVAACRISTGSSVDDVGSPSTVAAASTDDALLVSAGSGGSYTGPASGSSRLGPGKLGLGSPSRTSCSSIKSLVAQSRLRDAELGSSSGSSRLGNNSPQRFRAKFGVAVESPLAAAGSTMSSSIEGLSPLRHSSGLQGQMSGTGTVDQDSCSGHLESGPAGVSTVLGSPGDVGPNQQDDDDVVRGSVEMHQYRSSVHWKALSDSVTLSACELSLVRLGSRGSGAGSPAGGMSLAAVADGHAADDVSSAQPGDEAGCVTLHGPQLKASASQDWKVAENMLYFE